MARLQNFRMRTISALVHVAGCSLFLLNIPIVHAAPSGGAVVGGAGSIDQSGVTTTINQASQHMAIDWQSYNVNANERVHYIQPNASSISLNRILSNQGSTIAGRIDANGQVILVNPNGILFTPTSVLNVGGLIASGLDIRPDDFLNGHYIFNEVLGTDGGVANSGLITASLGGNVALLGRHVENNGVIVANLGTVNLAAGKETVLTFDNEGLLGVRVTKEILQSELGVDPAVANSGQIQAHGGRVLLTASASQDVFSRAVNTDGLHEATSVVVHEDGSFTLGDGADVINSGTINTSATSSNSTIGRIVLIGENVTSSGTLKADAVSGNGGEIELHAKDTTLLTNDSMTSARSESNGNGGTIKVLGDKVGLLDQASVDASGATGGGQVLIGGDQEGKNPLVRNANFIYLAEQSQIDAGAIDYGEGGKIIAFAEDTARIFGNLSARGGRNGGNGGFIETSGLRNFEITSVPDVSAIAGNGGTWLIDPYDLTISNVDDVTGCVNVNYSASGCRGGSPPVYLSSPFSSTGAGAVLDSDLIVRALRSSNVKIVTGDGAGSGDITLTSSADIDYNGVGAGDRTLILEAARNIDFQSGSSVYDGESSSVDKLNVVLLAGAGGAVTLQAGASITTQGGNFYVGYDGTTVKPVTSFTNNGTVKSAGAFDQAGGDVRIEASGAVTSTSLDAHGGSTGDSGNGATDRAGKAGGDVMINAGSVTVSGLIDTSGSAGTYDANKDGNNGQDGGNGGLVDITTSSGNIAVGAIQTTGGAAAGDYTGGTVDTGNGGDAGSIRLTVSGPSTITLHGDLTATGALGYISGTTGSHGSGGSIALDGNTVLASSVTLDASGATDTVVAIPTSGDVAFSGDLNATSAGAQNIEIKGRDVALHAIGNNRPLGALTVNAIRSIALSGNVATSGAVSMNFGSASGGTFTVDPDLSFTTVGGMTVTGGAHDDTFNVYSLFTGTVNGGGGTDTLTGPDGSSHDWSITSAGGGTLDTRLTFAGMESLTGGAGDDTFAFALGGSISGTVSGGVGNNRLIGRDAGNTWNIAASNTGVVSAGSGNYVSFTGIQNLTGGNGSDTFNFTQPSSAITGTIDGGVAGGTNSLSLAGRNGTHTFTLSGVGAGDVRGTGATSADIVNQFSNIQSLLGGSGVDTLIAPDAAVTWTIDAAKGGRIETNLGFAAMEHLIGALTHDDTFNFSVAPATANVTVDGGGQATVDTVSFAGVGGAVSFTLGTAGFANIEHFAGNTTDSTLIGEDNANTWEITAAKAGNVGGITFTGFTTLMGGTANDEYTFRVTPAVAAMTIDAGTGVDRVDLSTVTDPVSVQLGATGFSNIEYLTGNDGAINTLTGDNTANTWTLTGAHAGTVSGVNFTGFTTLIGALNQNDTFNFMVHPDVAAVTLDGRGQTGSGVGDAVSFAALTGQAVNVQLGTASISNIERYTGNNTNSTLTGGDGANTWTLTGVNDGTINSITFVDFNHLTGGNGIDSFTINGGGLTGLLNGGGGGDTLTLPTAVATTVKVVNTPPATVDNPANTVTVYQFETLTGNSNRAHTLVGPDSGTTWSINGVNSGNISFGTTVYFTGFANLSGGAADDMFTLTSSSTPELVTGMLSGGGHATGDKLTLAGMTGAAAGAAVRLSTLATDDAIDITEVEQIAGNNNSTLRAADSANTWMINDANDGTITSTAGTVSFSDMRTLQGGSDDDTFQVSFNGAMTAAIDGGGQRSADIADYSGQPSVMLNVGSNAFSGITGLEGVRGNGTNSTLKGPTPSAGTAAVTWTVDGLNRGKVSYDDNTQTLAFEGFNYLAGGNGMDAFVINGGALENIMNGVPGMISGGAGTNSLSINLAGTGVFSGGINYIGGTATDAITVNNHSAHRYLATYSPAVDFTDLNNTANAGPFEQLSYRYTDADAGIDQKFELNYRHAEAVTSEQLVDTLTVLGVDNNSAPETLTLRAGGFEVGGSSPVTFANVSNITLDGRGGADAIALDNPSVTGTLRLTAEAVTDTAGSTVRADTVVLEGVGEFGTTLDAIDTAITTLDLRNAGPVYISESAGLNLRTTGNVTNTGAFVIKGATAIDAGGGSLRLDNAANDFDMVYVNNAAAIELRDANDIKGGDMTAGSITLQAASGVGTTAVPLKTHTAKLTITNNSNGVYVANDQAMTVSIVNKGDIEVQNAGNLTVEKLFANGGDYSSNAFAGGSGVVTLNVSGGGAVTASGSHSAAEAPDIIGTSLLVMNAPFGTTGRRMSIMVPQTFGYYGPRGRGYVYYYGVEPDVVVGKENLAVSPDLLGLSNQQLVGVEALANLDPAVFTEIRNYYYEDVAIRLPDDQRYDYDDEEEEERKRRKEAIEQ